MAMFSLIGIAYQVTGIVREDRLIGTTISSCRIYLVGVNFIDSCIYRDLATIPSILVPMVAAFHTLKFEALVPMESPAGW